MKTLTEIDSLPRDQRSRHEHQRLLDSCTRQGCIPSLALHAGTCPLAEYNRTPEARARQVEWRRRIGA